jgi:diaminohydroxyphosphoribosylaminopyrimidine deaminase/5-amino-6-(5-phosphoribosylamino)uracil reductase
MEAEAAALNPGFIQRMQHGRPWVRVKLAASLDGRTALANGASKWITGEAARADVQRWRARSDAILTGIGTVLADDPGLTVRDLPVPRQPLRVVLDSALRCPPAARLLREGGSSLLVTAAAEAAGATALRAAGAEVIRMGGSGGRIDLAAVLAELGARQVNELLVEAGATLSGALLAAGLADELLLYYAPHLLGADARGLFALPPLARLAERVALEVVDVRAVGGDWRVRARINRD